MKDNYIKGLQAEKPSDGVLVKVHPEHWKDLERKDIQEICSNTSARLTPEGLILRFLHMDMRIDLENHCIYQMDAGIWKIIENKLHELVILVYLLHAESHTLEDKMVSAKELKDANFFQGPHELEVSHLLKKYGNNISGFRKAAESLDGKPLELADAAYMLMPFPKIPLYYLLWEGDEEFPPQLSILFDKSVERHLSADAIWGLVNLVSDYMISANIIKSP